MADADIDGFVESEYFIPVIHEGVPIWSFTVDLTSQTQPGGHLSSHGEKINIYVTCDSRVARVVMMGRYWNCLRIHNGMGGFVLKE